jgi:hypothetical protein
MSHVIGNRRKEPWNNHYESVIRSGTLADWEKLPNDNLKRFLEEPCLINFDKVSTALEVGCGRGFRSLAFAFGLLNRDGVSVYALDVASAAVDYANAYLGELTLDTPCQHPGQVCDRFKSGLPKAGAIRCRTTFRAFDFLGDDLPQGWPKRFDLVVDWMCLHEIAEDMLTEYAKRLSEVAERFLVVCAFAEEASEEQLRCTISGVRKQKYSREDIARLFPAFDVVFTRDYEADEHPEPLHEDGRIAPKRAYILIKRWNGCLAEVVHSDVGGSAIGTDESGVLDPPETGH